MEDLNLRTIDIEKATIEMHRLNKRYTITFILLLIAIIWAQITVVYVYQAVLYSHQAGGLYIFIACIAIIAFCVLACFPRMKIIIFKRDDESAERKPILAKEICPFCGNTNPLKAAYCCNCGGKL